MWKVKLKELTEKHTQKAIAKRVNVPQPTISFWLSGRHTQVSKKYLR
ncbi:helix-turn-helix domain-containing protein [Vibrio alginolyticus]